MRLVVGMAFAATTTVTTAATGMATASDTTAIAPAATTATTAGGKRFSRIIPCRRFTIGSGSSNSRHVYRAIKRKGFGALL